VPTSSTLRITRRAADRLRSGHLWIYRTDLEPNQTLPDPGALTTVTDSRNLPLGTATYSSASQIAARIVSRTPGLTRDRYLADLRTRIVAAIYLRRSIAPITASTTAHRLIFSEADNLPGIIADRYNDLVLLQLLTQGTAQDDVRVILTETLRAELSPNNEPLTIWERPDPRIREIEQLPAPPPGPLYSSLSSRPELVSPEDFSSRPDPEQAKRAEGGVERPASRTSDKPPTTTTFTLNGIRFHYDATAGQKTGAFLDQRLNYAAAARAVQASGKTKRALDICTYQGGFALHLAQVCAHVTGVDASRSALEAADRNLLLNPHLTTRCEIDWIEADAFDYLRHLDEQAKPSKDFSSRPERSGVERPAFGTTTNPGAPTMRDAPPAHERDAGASTNPNLFDAIVLDPPAFAKSKRAAESAARGYKELNLRAIRLLTPGGTLITNSCSHHVSLQDFTAIVASAAADAGRRVQLLETRAAAPDHPEILTLPETRYLKCLICRID
jgi:23S rRNA (cytosine1962-C5)-methyltransferase